MVELSAILQSIFLRFALSLFTISDNQGTEHFEPIHGLVTRMWICLSPDSHQKYRLRWKFKVLKTHTHTQHYQQQGQELQTAFLNFESLLLMKSPLSRVSLHHREKEELSMILVLALRQTSSFLLWKLWGFLIAHRKFTAKPHSRKWLSGFLKNKEVLLPISRSGNMLSCLMRSTAALLC